MGFEWGYDRDSDGVPLDPHDPHDLARLQWQDGQEAQRREDAWRAHMSIEEGRMQEARWCAMQRQQQQHQ
eukprot:4558592-Prymnesium_polylepis.1